MSTLPGDPLQKITLNLYAADVDWFKRRFGWGYSEKIRYLVREYHKSIIRQESQSER